LKKVAILQSNYVPWKGYFDIIANVDEFILYDDMQYTRRDWRNRNQIKTPNGLQWLTVPVHVKGKYYQTIRETQIDGTDWAGTHWKSLCSNYRRAPYFDHIAEKLEPIFMSIEHSHLSQLNRTLIDFVCEQLEIKTKISNSWDYSLVDGKTERLVDLCIQAKGTEYLSGPSAKGYLDESLFVKRGTKVTWFDYVGYPEYPQLWGGDFQHSVTILDLLFNCGKDSPRFFRKVSQQISMQNSKFR